MLRHIARYSLIFESTSPSVAHCSNCLTLVTFCGSRHSYPYHSICFRPSHAIAAMQAQHQPLCVPLEDIPILATTADTSSQQQGVLQERSVNQPHEYYTGTTSSQLKQHGSPGPTENAHVQRSTTAGTYYSGNVHGNHVGLAGGGVEKSEKQIRFELDRIYRMLARSDRYQKYREKQPVLSPAEVIARDAAEEKERARKEAAGEKRDKKDNTVWPDFLEHAFWRGKISRSCYTVSGGILFHRLH